MKIVHLSYAVPRPAFHDPIKWLDRISFITGIFESEAKYAEVTAFYHINCKSTISRSGVYYRFTDLKRWQLVFPFSFHAEVKKIDPDVVIVHGLIFPLQVLLLRFSLGPRTIIILQHHAEKPFHDVRQYLQRWADRYISAYFFSSIDLGKWWVDRNQIKSIDKVREIMGTSSIFYPMDNNEAKAITKVQGKRIYLWVGGLDANKDPLVVVRAFALIQGVECDAHLYMIYQTDDLIHQLQSLISSLGIEGSVTLVGKVEHLLLQYWFNSADFIISSSHYEGSGIAVCEALSCGCIPLVTDIPSFRMMTANGGIGFLFRAGDEKALFEVLRKSLTLNVYSEKEKVLKWFQAELSFEANARKILNVIQKSRRP